jgi:hypothetical protein
MTLSTETTAGQVLKIHKNVNNPKTGGERQDKYCDQKQQSQSGLSNGHITYAWRRHLTTTYAFGLLLLHRKVLFTRQRYETDKECPQKTVNTPCRLFERLYFFRSAAPPNGYLCFRSVFVPSKSASDSKTV